MIVSGILAATSKGLIGHKGGIPWSIPEDLRRFKEITSHKAVIMGRKTWESLPIKPLPNRLNIILTSTPVCQEGVVSMNTLQDALTFLKFLGSYDEVFVIGGSQIFTEALPLLDKIYFTRVKGCAVHVRDPVNPVFIDYAKFDPAGWQLQSETQEFDDHYFSIYNKVVTLKQ